MKSITPFLLKLGVVGSDVINFGCPFCHSSDRERHLFLYFDRLRLWDGVRDAAVLHFAPEPHLSWRIKSCGPRQYVTADLYPDHLHARDHAVERQDVTDIAAPADTFDLLICNHVLEHVTDDRRALSEVHRVLKPGGLAVLQTPYSTVLTRSIEDPGIATDRLRLEVYGQEDHVRLYGADFLDRIQTVGLRLRLRRHRDVSTDAEAAYYGMNPVEDLILVKKPTIPRGPYAS